MGLVFIIREDLDLRPSAEKVCLVLLKYNYLAICDLGV